MTRPFDPTKPVQCRNGRPARILSTDRKDSDLPIVALYQDNSGCEGLGCYSSEGLWSGTGGHALDLVNIPERKEVFMNLYLKQDTKLAPTAVIGHETLRLAETNRSPGGKTYKLTVEADRVVAFEFVSE